MAAERLLGGATRPDKPRERRMVDSPLQSSGTGRGNLIPIPVRPITLAAPSAPPTVAPPAMQSPASTMPLQAPASGGFSMPPAPAPVGPTPPPPGMQIPGMPSMPPMGGAGAPDPFTMMLKMAASQGQRGGM